MNLMTEPNEEALAHHLAEVVGCVQEHLENSCVSTRGRLRAAAEIGEQVLKSYNSREKTSPLARARAEVDEILDAASEIAGRRFGMSWRAEELADLELKIAALLASRMPPRP